MSSSIVRRAAQAFLAGIEKHRDELDTFVWVQLIEEQLPLYVCLLAMKRLLRRSKIEAVDLILGLLESRGDAHPLLYEFVGTYLFSCGKRTEAIAFLKNAALKWSRLYLL